MVATGSERTSLDIPRDPLLWISSPVDLGSRAGGSDGLQHVARRPWQDLLQRCGRTHGADPADAGSHRAAIDKPGISAALGIVVEVPEAIRLKSTRID